MDTSLDGSRPMPRVLLVTVDPLNLSHSEGRRLVSDGGRGRGPDFPAMESHQTRHSELLEPKIQLTRYFSSCASGHSEASSLV